MSVYIIAQMTIHDREAYDKYDAEFFGVFEKFDGEMLSVDEAPTVLDGEFTATRSVLIKFPSQKSAVAWMRSDEYQAIAQHRIAGSTANSIMVRGFEGMPHKG